MTVETELRRLQKDVGELVSVHDRGRDLSDFECYETDPAGFIRDVLRADPWSRQIDIAESVRDNALTVVRSGNGVGKDWIAAQLSLWWVYARRGLVLLSGPTERQVREVCMGEVARAFAKAKSLPGELYQMALRLGADETSGILAFTSTESSRLTGFHAPRILACLTEAQGCEDWSWEGLLACATGSEDRVLCVGNPLNPSGRFYTASRSKSWNALQISVLEHPNFVEGRTVIPGGPSQEFAQRIATEFGAGSNTERSRVMGEFPDQGEEGIFRRSWLEAAARRHEARAAPNDGYVLLAIDPAHSGPDQSAVAVLRGHVIIEIVTWSQADLAETVARLSEVLERYAIRPEGDRGLLVVDIVGLGMYLADRLEELGYSVVRFNGGSSPRSDHYLNARAESYWVLRQQLEAGTIDIPQDEDLFDELLAIRWRPTADGKVQLEAKLDLKSRIGRSPDKSDAVTMAVWANVVESYEEVEYDFVEYGAFIL